VHEVADVLVKTPKDLLFEKYHEEIVQKLGVTPSVFMELLNSHTEEQLDAALRVTRRAKANSQIKSSVPGFFINALRNGFTDPKEEEMKKQASVAEKGRVVDTLRQELESLREEAAQRINEQIKALTSEQPDVTEQAIASLRDNPYAKVIVEKKEKSAKSPLELEDYRKDKVLRDLVRQAIVDQHPTVFNEILEKYQPRIQALEESIRTVSR
jgi:hypothetical protein